MNRGMCSTGFAVAAFLCAASAYASATLVANNWQKDGSNVLGGSLTNEAHWSRAHAPMAGERMVFLNSLNGNYTVTFPEGAYTNSASFEMAAKGGKQVTMNGQGTSWVMPGSDDGVTEVYDDAPFVVKKDNNQALCKLLARYSTSTSDYSHAMAELSNFKFFLNLESDPALVLDGGTYNFRSPAGSEWTTSVKPLLLLCSGNGLDASTPSVTFRNGASLSAWNVGIQAGAGQGGRVVFDGGTHYVQALNFPDGSMEYANTYATESVTILTNGATLSAASMSFGPRNNKRIVLCLTGAGTELTVRGAVTAAGGNNKSTPASPMAHLVVRDGATARFQGAVQFVKTCGTSATTIDGGNVFFSGSSAKFGQADAANISLSSCSIVGNGGQIGSSVKMEIDGNTHVATTGTVWNISELAVGGYGNGGTPRVEIHGGSLYVTNATSIAAKDDSEVVLDGGKATFASAIAVGDGAGKSGSLLLGGETLFKSALNLGSSAARANGTLVMTGGVAVVEGHINIGNNNGATGTVTIAGGSFSNDIANTYVYLAKANALSFGELNVSGGEMFICSIYAGWRGHCAINVSGGLLRISNDLRLGCAGLSDGVYDVMTVSGGTVECAFSAAANLGRVSPSYVKLRLNGGRFVANGLKGGDTAQVNGGSGRADLEANGGTIVASSDCTVLSKFDSAVVNAGGLAIDTQGHSVTIDQNLSGTGVLTLTGGGTVTFASGVTCGVAVKVTDGTTVNFNGVSPAGLTLGDENGAGVLAATVGSTIAVAGDIVLNDFGISLSGTLVKDVDYAPLLTCTGTFDETSREKWADYLLSSLISPDDAVVFGWTESGGVTSLTVKRTDKVTRLIEVKEGTSNITWAVTSRATENQEVAVSNGAVCVISGDMSKGRLVKTGPGRLELSGSNTFLGGFDLSCGLLKILSTDSLGDGTTTLASLIGPATLEIAASAGSVAISNQTSFAASLSTNAAVFKTEGDLAMPIPRGTTYGTVFKRGAGQLTFTCDWDGNKKVDWSLGHLTDDNTGNNFTFPANQPSIPFDAETGLPPENAPYGKLTVVEGELVLRGTGAGTQVTFKRSPVFVGYPTAERSSGDAQPVLVIDNMYCDLGGAELRVGESINTANPWVVEPKVVVTNGATLRVNTVHLTGSNANNLNCSSLLYVEDSTVDSTYAFESHNSSHSGVVPRAVFVNSRLYSPRVNLRKPAHLWFTNSVVALSRSGSTYNSTTMTCYENNWTTRWTFSGGSIFCVNSIVRFSESAGATAQVLAFDDSEWRAGTGSFSFTDSFGTVALDIVAEGKGLVLAPADGETWTFNLALRGDGGFVKRGAGTVVFDGQYARQKGRTVAEEGVLDLDGTTWTGAAFGGGAGTVSNGTLHGARISLDVTDDGESWTADSVPHFSGCAFSGRTTVDLGRSEENPLTLPYRTLVVARYTGAAPNLAAWRLAGTGIPKTGATFVAENGEVRATVGQAGGVILLVR